MAPRRPLLVPLAALTALLGCTPPPPPSHAPASAPPPEHASVAPGVPASDPGVPAGPTTADDMPPAEPPPRPVAFLGRCRDEENAATDRVTACLQVLDEGQPTDIGPNMDSDRAEAIRALYALGHKTPITPPVQRALPVKLGGCVLIDEQSAAGVVSLMCKVAICGDPPDWVPYDLVLTTGELRTQQC